LPGPLEWAALDVKINVHESCDSATDFQIIARKHVGSDFGCRQLDEVGFGGSTHVDRAIKVFASNSVAPDLPM
jgi:hypothetical protein